jgi:hypothetical protein
MYLFHFCENNDHAIMTATDLLIREITRKIKSIILLGICETSFISMYMILSRRNQYERTKMTTKRYELRYTEMWVIVANLLTSLFIATVCDVSIWLDSRCRHQRKFCIRCGFRPMTFYLFFFLVLLFLFIGLFFFRMIWIKAGISNLEISDTRK